MEDLPDYERAMLETMLGELEDKGVFEWVGMDENGERIMQPNMEKMREEAPELYELMMDDVTSMLHNLYDMGLVTVEYTENLEPLFSVSEEGKKFMQEMGIEIGEEHEGLE